MRQASLVAWVLSLLIRLLAKTYRWKLVGLETHDQWWSQGEPRIMVFWHGDQIFMPWCYYPRVGTGRRIHPLISEHRDGQIATEALEYLGFRAIRGSSSRGAVRALVTLRKKLSEGCHIAITPDGPKGPVHKVKPGVISLASTSGVPIFPVVLTADRMWLLSSWDRMKIPKPFARVAIVAGPAITVPSGLSKDQLEQEGVLLENELLRLATHAESLVRAKDRDSKFFGFGRAQLNHSLEKSAR